MSENTPPGLIPARASDGTIWVNDGCGGVRTCFERGARKDTGGDGWADVWKRHHFAWEYKGKRADLDAAFDQLRQYSLALENPPLLIVSDMVRFRIIRLIVIARDDDTAFGIYRTSRFDGQRVTRPLDGNPEFLVGPFLQDSCGEQHTGVPRSAGPCKPDTRTFCGLNDRSRGARDASAAASTPGIDYTRSSAVRTKRSARSRS